MGTHPIFESDFDCLTALLGNGTEKKIRGQYVQRGVFGRFRRRRQ